MTRSGSRRFWLFIIVVLLGSAFYTVRKAQDLQVDIAMAEGKRQQLNRDLRAGNLFSAALADLDNFTINEKKATTLDILRHLNLEESTMKYETRAKSVRPVGGVNLYIRKFNLTGQMSYAEALNQVDWLHNTNKVVIDRVKVEPGRGFGDLTDIQIEGTLYGLDKQD